VTGIASNPAGGDDKKTVFRVSSAKWHDKAFHNGARRRRFQLRKQALDKGIDITALEGKIPSGKTMSAAKFLEHAREAVLAYPTLYEHHQRERVVRWKVYRKEQKALHSYACR